MQSRVHTQRAKASLCDLLRTDIQLLQEQINSCKHAVVPGTTQAYATELNRFIAHAEPVLEQLKQASSFMYANEVFLPLYDLHKTEREKLQSYDDALKNGELFAYVQLAKKIDTDYKEIQKKVKGAENFCQLHVCDVFEKSLLSSGMKMLDELNARRNALVQSPEYHRDLTDAKNHELLIKQQDQLLQIELNKKREQDLRAQELAVEQKKEDLKASMRTIETLKERMRNLQEQLAQEKNDGVQKKAENVVMSEQVNALQRTIAQYRKVCSELATEINQLEHMIFHPSLNPESDEYATGMQGKFTALKEWLKKIPVS
ncbi:MAG: hypothetical protein WCE21_03055 [Candidatus Babeliales bacterium]